MRNIILLALPMGAPFSIASPLRYGAREPDTLRQEPRPARRGRRPRAVTNPLAFTIILLSAFCVLSPVRAQSTDPYTDLYDFSGNPPCTVVFDIAGDVFGTMVDSAGAGSVWEITASGSYKDLHDFGGLITNADGDGGPDGEFPYCGVTFDSEGNMYGTTTEGGANGEGIVWEISSSGVYSDLHDFGGTVTNSDGTSGPDGTAPSASVVFDNNGNMYGTAPSGGPNSRDNNDIGGVLWEITADGLYRDLHDFGGTVTNADGESGPDGWQVIAGAAFDSAWNMYGATYEGGANATDPPFGPGGMVWELSSGGVYKDLHDFAGTVTNADGSSGPDGANSAAPVVVDGNGDIVGTTFYGGSANCGMLWEIPAAGGYKDLHDFGGTVTTYAGSAGPDAVNPVYQVLDPSGNIYGTAYAGGADSAGAIWELSAAGTYEDRHDFGGTITNADGDIGPDGEGPWAGVSLDGAGNLYGTAFSGGAKDAGMLWRLDAPVASPAFSVGTEPFANSVSVTISDQTPGAVIYYTNDGSTPTPSSPLYEAPLDVTGSMTINAIAVAPAYSNSAVVSATYTLEPTGSRVITVQSISGVAGWTVTVPVSIVAGGTENYVSGSLNFDPAVLTYSSAAVGAMAAGATLSIDTSAASTGNVGFTLSLPLGSALDAGTDQLLAVTFNLAAGAGGDGTAVGWSDFPTARQVLDASADAISDAWSGGTVTVDDCYEGDVLGHGTVDLSDWVEVGRIVVGLDPQPTGLAYQAGDCAPRSTLGSGEPVNLADWVQVGRYLVGLDPPTPVGGPTAVTP